MSESTRLRKAVCELRRRRDDLIARLARLDTEHEECQRQINRILEEREDKRREYAELALQRQTLLTEVQTLRENVKQQQNANNVLKGKIDKALEVPSCTITMDDVHLKSEGESDETA